MLMMASAGHKPSATTDESSENMDRSCAIYPAPTDDFDAELGVAVCHNCAESDV